jgi:cytochrome P450
MAQAGSVLFNPFSADFHANRQGVYRTLRDTAPQCVFSDAPPTVLLTRYADVNAVLRDRGVRMSPEGFRAPPWLGDGPAAQMYANQMLMMDHPEHTRLRRVTTPAFRPKTIIRLQRALEEALVERISVLREMGEFDAVSDLAEHVPAVAVCTMLGIPASDWPSLIRGAVDFVLVLSPIPLDDAQRQRADAMSAFYLDYFRELICDRRRHPRGDDDFLTTLIAAHDAEQLTEAELLVTAHSVLNAGFETTMSALANAVLGLLSEPDQWRLLVDDPDRAAQAVEEALRWEAPAQLLTRYACQPIELDTGSVTEGTTLILAAASANRDERRFEWPDRFDLQRADNAHLSLSAGRHACIGAHLGRLELQIALRALSAAFPDLRLADDPGAEREPNPVFPTLRHLRVVTGR